MSTREQESNLHERVAKLEAGSDAVIRKLDEIQQEMREIRQDMKDGFSQVRLEIRDLGGRTELRLDSWLKWVLGFIFSSWLTLMTSIWFRR